MRIGRHLKHWLVPHHRNGHRPHLIRAKGLALVAAVILAVQAAGWFAQPAAVRTSHPGSVLAYATDITPVDLLNLTNKERAANGLPPLRLNARLNQSATLKAQNMFAENYWAHVSPSGIQPWYWFQQAGYNYQYAGENLAKDFDTSSGAVQGWMNSPGHRANILSSNYTEVGFAVQNGTLVGGQTTLVVAHYGATPGTTVAATVPAPAAKPQLKPVPATPTAVPAPTLVSTPAPSLAPAPAPVQTPAPTSIVTPLPTAPSANGTVSRIAPAPKSYSLFMPLSLRHTLTPGTFTTILLLTVLLGVYIFTHVAVWRKGLRRWQQTHYRLFAAGQIGVLVIAIVLLAVSGFGQVS